MVAARIHSILRHSLVKPSPHSLLDLLSIPPDSPRLLNHLTDLVISTVTFALKRPLSKPATDAFPAFVQNVLHRASATTALVLSTMVYISRAKKYLKIASEAWVLERVFLGAIVCANKYLNDSCLKNQQWSTVTQIFGCRDMARIEREWYDVLDWKLSVSEADILEHYPALSPAIPIVIRAAVKTKSPASEKTAATPYEEGAFDAFPADVHSPHSSSPSSAGSSDSSGSTSPSSLSPSSRGYSPRTPGTSGFSPTRDQAFSVARDSKEESRGRPTISTKSAVGHRSQSPLRHSSVRITRCARLRQAPYFPPHARQRLFLYRIPPHIRAILPPYC